MSLALLGILNSQAAGGGAGGYNLLESATITTNNTFLSIQGLDAYSDYKHLQIRFTTNSYALGSNWDNSWAYVNNFRTGAFGWGHELRSDGSVVTAETIQSGNPLLWQGRISKRGETSQVRTSGIIDILDFSNPNKKTTIMQTSGYGMSGVYKTSLNSAKWDFTTPLNRIDFENQSGGFQSTSRYFIYGVK